MRAVIWTDEALADYTDSILTPIAEKNPYAAEKIAGEIKRAIDLLTYVPLGHPDRIAGTY